MATKNFLDKTGLAYFWGKVKALIPTKTSDLTNDSDYVTNTSYATNATGGVVKITGAFGLDISGSGEIKGRIYSSSEYSSMWSDAIVSKGTMAVALADKQDKGDTETYSIASASWSAVAGVTPFAYFATITAMHTITANTIAELYNDNAVAFANYGFSIASISGQTVTIYALDAPTAATSLTINYKEGA